MLPRKKIGDYFDLESHEFICFVFTDRFHLKTIFPVTILLCSFLMKSCLFKNLN